MSEALKYISKAKNIGAKEQEGRVGMYEERIRLIEKFIGARALFQSEEEAAVSACKDLLDDPKIDVAVKIGDIYGILVEHYAAKGKPSDNATQLC